MSGRQDKLRAWQQSTSALSMGPIFTDAIFEGAIIVGAIFVTAIYTGFRTDKLSTNLVAQWHAGSVAGALLELLEALTSFEFTNFWGLRSTCQARGRGSRKQLRLKRAQSGSSPCLWSKPAKYLTRLLPVKSLQRTPQQ